MSITKFINGKNRRTQALQKGIDYILNPDKTSRTLIHGNGIDVDSAYEDMNTIQTLLRKTTGRRYIHYIVSFDLGVTPETAYDVSVKCANYFAKDYQYILAVHTNTANVHAHIIMNAVNIHTGKKFSQSKSELFKFRDYVNDCLVQNDLNPISVKTSNKLVHEEVFEHDEFELDYDTSIIDLNCENNVHCNFSEVNQLHAYGWNSSFFGPIDCEEAQQIQSAEVYHSQLKEIIHFFQGLSPALPSGINMMDAKLLYEQWRDGQNCLDEEANYGFFAKNIAPNN